MNPCHPRRYCQLIVSSASGTWQEQAQVAIAWGRGLVAMKDEAHTPGNDVSSWNMSGSEGACGRSGLFDLQVGQARRKQCGCQTHSRVRWEDAFDTFASPATAYGLASHIGSGSLDLIECLSDGSEVELCRLCRTSLGQAWRHETERNLISQPLVVTTGRIESKARRLSELESRQRRVLR